MVQVRSSKPLSFIMTGLGTRSHVCLSKMDIMHKTLPATLHAKQPTFHSALLTALALSQNFQCI